MANLQNNQDVIYPEHDPFCVIYELGKEHCNCYPLDDDQCKEDDDFE